jgi:multidrug efflux pump subunit AcrA (membrane-fusion protein)
MAGHFPEIQTAEHATALMKNIMEMLEKDQRLSIDPLYTDVTAALLSAQGIDPFKLDNELYAQRAEEYLSNLAKRAQAQQEDKEEIFPEMDPEKFRGFFFFYDSDYNPIGSAEQAEALAATALQNLQAANNDPDDAPAIAKAAQLFNDIKAAAEDCGFDIPSVYSLDIGEGSPDVARLEEAEGYRGYRDWKKQRRSPDPESQPLGAADVLSTEAGLATAGLVDTWHVTMAGGAKWTTLRRP